MADVVDDFGRVTRLAADFESLSESLRSAVGKAVEYAAGKAKENTDDLKGEFEKLAEAMEELGEDVKDSLKSTKDFVEEVKKAAESVEKARASKASGGRDTLADAQREQTRILQQILAAQQKAVSEKAAKFTTGATALSSPATRRPALKEMGFRPRGADKIPAMVSPGEFVVSKRGAMGNEPLLDRINRGYMRGGKVKPEYLSGGSSGTWRGRRYNITGDSMNPKIVIEGYLDEETKKRLKEDFAHLGENISVEFSEKFNERMRKTAATWLASMGAAFTGRGDPFQIMFEGAVKDVTEFRREMRNLAFQTEGITGNFREAQAEFAKIGKDIVGVTGKNVTAFQKAYMENARKGFKDQKAGMKVLESGLKLSTLIGSETQATAELFADWHRELGLGAVQMGRMANNMQMVARNTGVTGKELIDVMKSSEQILKNLRNQGTLTTTAARNITQAMAEFKKQGFGEEGQKMLSAMSGYSAFQGADDGTRTILGIASQEGGVDYRDLMFGDVVQDADKMGQMAGGLQDFMAKAIGVDPKNFDLEMITADQRRSLSIALEGMGTSLGAAEVAINTFQKSAKGLGGELSEFEKIRKSANATEKEKKEAEKKMNDMLLSSSMDMLGSITQVAEKFGDKSMSEISKILGEDNKFAQDFQTGARDMAAMAPYFSDSIKKGFGLSGTAEQMAEQIKSMDIGKQMELRSVTAADQLDKAMAAAGKGNKDFASRMQKAMASGDIKMVKSIGEEMAAAQSGLQVSDAKNVDPIEALEQSMHELNQTIRNAFSPLTGAVLDLVGWLGLVGVQIGMMGGTLGNLVGGPFIQWLTGGGFGGGLVDALDKYARKTATSGEVGEGIFKKFFKTYARSRDGAPSPYGGRLKGRGVFESLNNAFGGLRDDMMKGMSNMRGATVEFFQAAYQNSIKFFRRFSSGFKKSRNLGEGLFSSIARGFRRSTKSFDFTRGILHKMGEGLTRVNGKYLQTLASIHKKSPALARFVRNSVELGKSFMTLNFGGIFKNFGRTMKSGFSVFKNAFNPASWKALFSGGLKGMKGAILAGSGGTAQIIFAAIDMVFGAVTGFMNTGKRFEGVMKAMGKSTNEMTWGMYASSTLAGGLVGILDGLTFGLLRFSGAAEFLEQTLSFVLYAVFSVVEGIVEGILYPFRMVWSAVKHIGAQFKGIGDSILSVFNAIAGIFGAEAGSWSEAFAMVYPWLKAIGRVIGYVVGLPLAGALWLLVKGISAALVPLQMLVAAITGVIRVLAGFIQFFVDIFRVGLWQATKNLAWTVFDAVLGIFRPITDFLWSLMGDILAPFQWLANILCWNSIVPDMVMEIVKWFAMLPVRIFGFLVKIPYMIGKALLNVPAMIGSVFSNVGEYLSGFGTDGPFSFLMSQLGVFYSFIGGSLKNLVGMVSGVFDVLYGILTLDFGKIWEGLSSFGSALVSQAKNFGSFVWKMLSNSMSFLFKMLKKIPTMLIHGMKAVFFEFPSWLVGKLMDGVWAIANFLFLTLPKMMWDGFKKTMSSVKKVLWDTIWWPFKKLGEGLKAIFYDFPIWLGKKLMEGLQAIFYDLPMWLGKTIWDGMASIAAGIPGALYGALHSAASAIGLGWLVEKLGGGKPGAKGEKKDGPAQASAAGGVGSFLTGVVAIGAAAVGLRRLSPSVLKLASSAFGKIGNLVPKDIGKYGTKAFSLMKEYASSAFSKIKGMVPTSITKTATDAFSKIKGMVPTSITKTATDAFVKLKGMVPTSITKTATDAFSKIKGMVPTSITKTATDAFSKIKGMVPTSITKTATDAFVKLKGMVPTSITKTATDAFSKIKGMVPTSITKTATDAFKFIKNKGIFPKNIMKFVHDTFKNTKIKGIIPKNISKFAIDSFKSIKTFFSPMSKGFSKAIAEGRGLFGAAARGVKSQIGSVLKGRSIVKFASDAFKRIGSVVPTNVSKYAMSAFSKIKGLSGGIMKMASGAFSRLRGGGLGGLIGKGTGLAKGLFGRATSALSKVGGFGGLLGKAGGVAAGLAGKAGGVLGRAGGVAAGLAGKAGGVLGKAGGMAAGLTGKAGGALGSVAGKGLGALAKRIPVLGALVDFGARKLAGEDTGKAATGAAGGLGGAMAGAAIGQMLIPIPGVGAAVGAVIGGLGGGWLADKLYDNIGPVVGAVGKGISSAASFVWDGIKGVGSKLWEGASWMKKKVGEAASAAWEGTKKLASNLWDGAKNLGSKLWEGTKGLASKLSDGAKWLKENVGAAAFGPIGMAVEGIKKVGSWFSGWFGGGEKENKEEKIASMAMAKIEAQTVMLSTGVGQHAIPAAKPGEGTPAADVEPVHLRDITGTILRDRAGATGNRLQSDELSRMEEASNRQVSELEQIRQGIQELVSLMRPRGGTVGDSGDAGRGNTKDPRRPMHAARFGKMKFGVPGGLANRSIVNTGEV